MTIRRHGEFQRARSSEVCEERKANARWRRFVDVRRRISLGPNQSKRGSKGGAATGVDGEVTGAAGAGAMTVGEDMPLAATAMLARPLLEPSP